MKLYSPLLFSFKVESVELALNILDGYDVRGHKIKVQRAKFEMRGEYNPALKPKKKKGDKEKMQKIKEKWVFFTLLLESHIKLTY